MPPTTPDSTSQFVRLLSRHDQDLLRWVLPLVGRYEDARDAVQDAAVLMWEKFDEYDARRPFLPWAMSFARYAALNVLRKNRRYSFLSDELVELLAEEGASQPGDSFDRLAALEECLDKLPKRDRRLIRVRYGGSGTATVGGMAGEEGMSANVLYKSLSRIRRRLIGCTQARLGEGDP